MNEFVQKLLDDIHNINPELALKRQKEYNRNFVNKALNEQCDIHVVMCRTCSTCGHLKGSKCMLSGYSATTERTYPTVCGRNFEKWTPKPPKIGLKKRLLSFWYGT